MNKKFKKAIDVFRENPVAFVEQIIRIEPYDWQKEVLNSLKDGNWVSIRSGRGPGKTALLSWCILWFLVTRPKSRVPATAPTQRQLRDHLWGEIASAVDRSPLLDRMLTVEATRVRVKGYRKTWFATAVSSSNPKNMSGYHSPYGVLCVVDEASGVDDDAIEETEGSLTGSEEDGPQIMLLAGNPNNRTGYFAKTFRKPEFSQYYDNFHVNYKDVPKSQISPDQVEKWREKWGETSNWFLVNVLGEFPTEEDDVVIPYKWCQRATETEHEPEYEHTAIGVDVAGAGANETVIVTRHGPVVGDITTYKGSSESVATGKIIERIEKARNHEKTGEIDVKIDEGGLGGPVADRVEEVVSERNWDDVRIIRCNFGGSLIFEDSEDRLLNSGMEMWMHTRSLLKDEQITLPNDDDLIGQLSSRPYRLTSAGKMKLVSKEKCEKKVGFSPDRADALVLAFYPKEPEQEYKIEHVAPLGGLTKTSIRDKIG